MRQTHVSIYTLYPLPPIGRGYKRRALILLRTKSSKPIFEEEIEKFKSRLFEMGYSLNLLEMTFSDVNFEGRKLSPPTKQKQNEKKQILH